MTVRIPSLKIVIGLCLLLALCGGCESEIRDFPSDRLYAVVAQRRSGSDDPVPLDKIAASIDQLFGTPSQPRFPQAFAGLIELEQVARSAGPVASDEAGIDSGLYRKHCAGCHGISGDGHGPSASLLTPYPRDFRPGVFKYKSTRREAKPTHDDLLFTLTHGIAGTAMPSFSTIPEADLEALVQYTIYLSARGETQRRLIDAWMTNTDVENDLAVVAEQLASEVAESWLAATDAIETVPAVPESKSDEPWWRDAELIAQGKTLFEGPQANCASCHGPGGNGQAVTLDYDDWTKEYTTKINVIPTDRQATAEFRKLGAPAPRAISPRRLDWGVYHGDDSDDALYRRLTVGIAGTPMPGLLVKSYPDAPGVSEQDVWSIIAYLRSLRP